MYKNNIVGIYYFSIYFYIYYYAYYIFMKKLIIF